MYDPSSPSDHNIISATLDVPSFNYHSSNSHSPVQYVIDKTRQPDLLESTEHAFSSLSDSFFSCNDTMCSDSSHKDQLDNLANKMHNIISDACKSTFSTKKKPSPSPFSWSDNLKKLRDNSKWWHWLWLQAGKPLSGHIYSIMKSTRSLYHREIKRVKFEETQRRYCSLVRHAKNPNKIYQKMRMISGNNKAKFIPAINGKTGSEAANEFARDLTNFQNVTLDEFAVRELNLKLLFPTSYLISPANISDAIIRLSSNKPDVNNISSSVIKLLGPQFIFFLTRLFNSLLIHNHIPVILTKSTLHPILKNNKKNVSDTSSYRLIAIISVFVKILDYVTLSLFHRLFETNDCEFGYKSRHSTKHAGFLLRETIQQYFNSDNKNVFACFLDASKAFDSVDHTKLFSKLLVRGVSPIFIRLY